MADQNENKEAEKEKLKADQKKQKDKEIKTKIKDIESIINGLENSISDLIPQSSQQTSTDEIEYNSDYESKNTTDKIDNKINQEENNKEYLLQERARLLIEEAENNQPDTPGDYSTNLDGQGNIIYFNSKEDLERFSAEMAQAYKDLDIAQFTSVHNNGHTHVSHLPEACRGKNVLFATTEELEKLRVEISKELEEGKTSFAKEYLERNPDYNHKETLSDKDPSEKKIVGFFTQMLSDRENSFNVRSLDQADSENSVIISEEIIDETLTGEQQGFQVTIKLLNGKLEELLARLQDGEGSSDFAEQIEMLTKLVEQQNAKLIESQSQEGEENEKDSEDQSLDQRIIELSLKEAEMEKFLKFCEDNDLEIIISKDDKQVLGEHTKRVLENKNRSQGISSMQFY